MLFLLQNGKYKGIHPAEKPEKAIKKAEKLKDRCTAILIECFSYLHSDIYTIIDPKHLKVLDETITLTYTIGVFLDDAPMDSESMMTRTITISNTLEFYRAAALLYQFANIDNAIGFADLTRHVEPVHLIIQYEEGRKEEWTSESSQSFLSFINDNDFICDTDTFLDASVATTIEKVEGGHYITRKIKVDSGYSVQHYWHDRKFFLRLADGKWSLVTNIQHNMEDYKNNSIYAYCIAGSGVMYMAPYYIMREWNNADSVFIGITAGRWIKLKLKDSGEFKSIKAKGISSIDANDNSDIFAFALYLPQLWNLLRYLNIDDTPLRIQADFLLKNHMCKSGAYRIEPADDTEAINVDLFAIFTKILLSDARNISFED